MNKPLWRVGKEELDYIKDVVKSGLTGEMNRRFEEAFAEKYGVKYAIAVNFGTSALHAALAAGGVVPGDEVIVPPLTFAATAMSVLQQGATPVFADIDSNSFTIDPEKIENKITKRTKAIIPVSLYGLSCDIDTIMKIASRYGLIVIEDDAQCMLGTYKGRVVGSISHMATFSFERSKHMTTGNGGMIITNNEEFADTARKFSVLGYSTVGATQASYKVDKDVVQQPEFSRHQMIGFNYRLPELCAAMGLAQLDKLSMFVELRQEIASLYDEVLQSCSWLVPQYTPEGYTNTYWTYAVKLDSSQIHTTWQEFRSAFLKEGGHHFYAAWKINYLEPAFTELRDSDGRPRYQKGLCPIAEQIQPALLHFKTNCKTLEQARKDVKALVRVIHQLEAKA